MDKWQALESWLFDQHKTAEWMEAHFTPTGNQARDDQDLAVIYAEVRVLQSVIDKMGQMEREQPE